MKRSLWICPLLLAMTGWSLFADGPPLRIGMEMAYPPFEMTDEQGKPAGVSVELAWKNTFPVTAAAMTPPGIQLVPSVAFAAVEHADLLCVPGGPGHIELLADEEVLAFVRRIATDSRFVTSVCTGA